MSLKPLAHHLRHADSIIFLNEGGEINRQGTLEVLLVEDEIVRQLLTQTTNAFTSRSHPEIPKEMMQELIPLENGNIDPSRRTGDIKVYAYYANIAGWWTMAAYFVACASFVFGTSFPCGLIIRMEVC